MTEDKKGPLERLAPSEANANTRDIVPVPEGGVKWWDFTHAPCFRETLLWSLSAATLGGGYEAVRGRGFIKTGNIFVRNFSVVAIFCWGICRYEVMQRHEQVEKGLRERGAGVTPRNEQKEEKK
mmetsp:Transcript_6202/g.15676  ORF Transcript_6202/g.15676 Transcript_6202/m.15676 type:complete len:124 (-) Transcript_6202:168-539(-)